MDREDSGWGCCLDAGRCGTHDVKFEFGRIVQFDEAAPKRTTSAFGLQSSICNEISCCLPSLACLKTQLERVESSGDCFPFYRTIPI